MRRAPASPRKDLTSRAGYSTLPIQVVRAWKAQGATPLSMGVEAFARYMLEDIAKWAHIVKVSGAKVDE